MHNPEQTIPPAIPGTFPGNAPPLFLSHFEPEFTGTDLIRQIILLFCGYFLVAAGANGMGTNADIFLYLGLALFTGEYVLCCLQSLGRNQWEYILGFGWMLLVACGGFWYAVRFRPDIDLRDIRFFVFAFLSGYAMLRLGCILGLRFSRTPGLVKGFVRILPLQKPVQAGHIYAAVFLGLFFGMGMFSFFVYFNNFPIFSEDPALARYLYFNGPYTMGLTRFSYRIFLSGTEIQVMMLFYLAIFHLRGKPSPLPFLVITTLILAIAILSINASRGPLVRITVFCLLAASKKISQPGQMAKLILATFLVVLLLFFYSVHRSGKKISITNIDSLDRVIYPFFPEVAEGSLVLEAFHGYNEPYLMGKTFLSGALTFIPSAVFPFREDYDINRYNLELLGIESGRSGGIRLTMMIETYINWAMPGVLCLCLLVGLLLGQSSKYLLLGGNRFSRANTPVKEGLDQNTPKPEETGEGKTAGFGILFFQTFLLSFANMGSGLFFLFYAAVGNGIAIRILNRDFAEEEYL